MWLLMTVAGCQSAPKKNGLPAVQVQTSDESRFVEQFKREFPDLAAKPRTLNAALMGYRAARIRQQALAIELRQQYPNATDEEMQVLLQDRLLREGPPGGGLSQAPAMAPMAPMPMLSCISMDLGLYSTMDCL